MPYTENTLEELALMYGTDKGPSGHNYIPFYEKHLPKNPKKILEIGVHEGRSIRMWLKYFPDAQIHGLDLFKENPIPFQDPRVTWHQGNQCDWELLERLRNEDFDIIIDDGSHNARQQMITFFGLFAGKDYFIEDIHCNRDIFYSEGLPYCATVDSLFKNIEHAVYNGERDFDFEIESANSIILIRCS